MHVVSGCYRDAYGASTISTDSGILISEYTQKGPKKWVHWQMIQVQMLLAKSEPLWESALLLGLSLMCIQSAVENAAEALIADRQV